MVHFRHKRIRYRCPAQKQQSKKYNSEKENFCGKKEKKKKTEKGSKEKAMYKEKGKEK